MSKAHLIKNNKTVCGKKLFSVSNKGNFEALNEEDFLNVLKKDESYCCSKCLSKISQTKEREKRQC